jgi:FlaA1/EpsC-like NDP-sugar epimerase
VTMSDAGRIAIEGLLGRESVFIGDGDVRSMIAGRVVLVTGAGGSIGGEICRQLTRFQPARLVFLDNSEFALYQVQEEFAFQYPDIQTVPLVGDVKDVSRAEGLFARYRPHVVFHAAAYKHVPLMERDNAWQALVNNVIGTQTVARAAIRYAAAAFVLISTDKAVSPVSVMGASKRLAEMICQALGGEEGVATRFKIVRFGNVVGSAGSVIPKFQQQIERGGPVTVTHPEATRYFMSIAEAARLVLEAGSMGEGGEIFVMDMGRPVKIADLARDMIRLAGRSEREVPIEFTGLRPGERLHEDALAQVEETLPTPHPKLRIARSRAIDARSLEVGLQAVANGRDEGDEAARRLLKRLVPEYREQPLAEAGADASGLGRQPACDPQ